MARKKKEETKKEETAKEKTVIEWPAMAKAGDLMTVSLFDNLSDEWIPAFKVQFRVPEDADDVDEDPEFVFESVLRCAFGCGFEWPECYTHLGMHARGVTHMYRIKGTLEEMKAIPVFDDVSWEFDFEEEIKDTAYPNYDWR